MKMEIRKKLENMRSKYESFSYDEVVGLDWIEEDPIQINGKKYYPSVWSRKFPDQDALLVVQLTRWYFLKMIGSTDCIGFTINPTGVRQNVDEKWLMNEVGYP